MLGTIAGFRRQTPTLASGRDRVAVAMAVVSAILVGAFTVAGLDLPVNGGVLRFVLLLAVPAAAVVAALLVMRPWPGLVAWILAAPVLNAASAQLPVAGVQLILSTPLLVAFAVGVVIERPWATVGWRPLRMPLVIAGILCVLAISSIAVAADTTRAVPIALHGLVEPVALAALAIILRPSVRQVAGLAIAMGVSVAGASVMNLVRFVVRTGGGGDLDVERGQLAKLTYFNVGIYGDMLTMALPLLLGTLLLLAARRRTRGWSALVGLGIAVELVGLYLTLSKSAWLGTLVAVTLLLLLVSHTWRARVATLAGAILISAAIVPWPAPILDVLSKPLASDYRAALPAIQGTNRSQSWDPNTPEGEVSITERYYATVAALQIAIHHPLLGVGPGGFAAEYEARYRPTASTRGLDSAHDLVPYVAAEFGLPAAGLLAATLLAALLLAWQASRSADLLVRKLGLALGCSLIGFLIVSATFGVDLYRVNRLMNTDVQYAALVIAMLWSLTYGRARAGRPVAEAR